MTVRWSVSNQSTANSCGTLGKERFADRTAGTRILYTLVENGAGMVTMRALSSYLQATSLFN